MKNKNIKSIEMLYNIHCFKNHNIVYNNKKNKYFEIIKTKSKKFIDIIYINLVIIKIASLKNFINVNIYNIYSNVTMVITSCNRMDLLLETLESFTNYNTYPIKKILLIEDSGIINKKYIYTKLSNIVSQENIEVIVNDVNLGQMYSVDRIYTRVNTKYIFHCEDDWNFYSYSFIEKSQKIFNMYDQPERENLLQIWLRNHNELINFAPFTKYSSMLEELGVKYNYVFSSNPHWKGFSMNPGLKKLEDYQNIGNYEKIIDNFNYICEYCVFESLIGIYYFNHGFITISLDLDGYVDHLGWGSSIKFGKGNNALNQNSNNLSRDMLYFTNLYTLYSEYC